MIGRGTMAWRPAASAAPGRRSALALATVALLLTLVGALAARPALGAGEGPVSVGVTNLPITFNASFSPKALSPTKPTPVALVLEGGPRFYSAPTDLAAVGVRSLELELDRHIGPMPPRCRSALVSPPAPPASSSPAPANRQRWSRSTPGSPSTTAAPGPAARSCASS